MRPCSRLRALEAAIGATEWATTVFGAAGYDVATGLEKRHRDLLGLRIADGTTDLLRSQVARAFLGEQMYQSALNRLPISRFGSDLQSRGKMEQTLSRDAAIDRRLLIVASGCRIAPTIRVVAAEDDGRDFGPVKIDKDTIVRDGVILSTGVSIGAHVLVGHNCVVRRCVKIGEGSVVSHLVSIQHEVVIEARVRVSSLTHLTGGMLIEDDVQIGAGVATVDDNFMEWPQPRMQSAPILRRGCRIGSGTTILGGIEIGRNTLIGAGSVVTRTIPENVVAFGNPAYVQHDLPPGSSP
jgi:acetyltransferase-like isoleucine patch superfamily enzyme